MQVCMIWYATVMAITLTTVTGKYGLAEAG